MHAVSRGVICVVCACGLAVLAGGCSPSKVKITGQLTKNGKPLKVSEKTQVTVSFAGEDESKKSLHLAKLNPADSSFEVEMPPGKYRASVVIFDHEKSLAVPIPQSVQKEVHDFTSPKQVTIEIGK